MIVIPFSLRRLVYGALLMMGCLLGGCGNDVITISVVPQPTTHPTITASHFSQNTANLSIDGSVDFSAPVDDLLTISLTILDSQGVLRYRSQPEVNRPGERSGTVPFSVSYAALPAGNYTLEVYLTNRQGGNSNVVSTTFSR